MQSKTHINKGLTVAATAICFNATIHFNKTIFEEWTTIAFASIFIGGIIVSLYLYGKEVDNNITFSGLFSYGFKTTAVATCIYFIYTLLALYIFFPHFIEEKFNRGIEEAKTQGLLDEKRMKENMEMGAAIGKKILFYTYFAGSIMGTLLLGVIGSLIGSVGIPKKSQEIN